MMLGAPQHQYPKAERGPGSQGRGLFVPHVVNTTCKCSALSLHPRSPIWESGRLDGAILQGRRFRPAPFLLYPHDMSDPSELYVEVRSEEIVVVVPNSTYAATYCKSTGSACLTLTDVSSPDKADPRSTMTAAQFLGLAWQAANDKARELGWIA